jgi:hypothetical protein
MSESHPAPSTQDESKFCPDCGYALRGIDSPRCPECGMEIDWETFTSPIPWEYRGQMGRLHAFNRTLMLAAIRPKLLSSACAGPVHFQSARLFRWAVAVLASLPLIALWIGIIIWQRSTWFLGFAASPDVLLYGPAPWGGERVWEGWFLWAAGASIWPVLPIAVVLTFLLATSIVGVWFRSGALATVRRDRAVSLSQYACAPLVCLVIPLASGTAAVILDAAGYGGLSNIFPFLSCASAGVIAAIGAMWLLSTLRIFKGSTQPSNMRLIAAGVTIPILWLLSALVGMLLFPAVVGLVWIMIDSLR